MSLFSGIGGFELGIQNAYENFNRNCISEQASEDLRNDSADDSGLRERGQQNAVCVGYSEIDRHAISVYRRQFPNHKNYGDITKIDPGELPDFDLLVGGFPCQAFSIAGQRRGFEDTRGTLFFEIARIVKQKQPRLLLLENVKGLLSHDDGSTFGTIIATLSELGYCVEWQILNSKNHGVPQNRERVFIVGHLGGFPGRQVFPIFGTGRKDNQPNKTEEVVYWKNSKEQWVEEERDHTPTIKTQSDLCRQPLLRVYDLKASGSETRRGTISEGGVAKTLDSQCYQGVDDKAMIRRLTPKECEMLQGFPDDWTKFGIAEVGGLVEISDSQRYKCAGNAVTTKTVQAIIESFMLSQPEIFNS